MNERELQILMSMLSLARELIESRDPLMLSQYRHLYGRITALIAEKGGDYEVGGQQGMEKADGAN